MASEKPTSSLSVNQRRWRKFKSLKRGYFSFLLLTSLYALSFLLPLLVNNKALVVKFNSNYSFPAFSSLFTSGFHSGVEFGEVGNNGECNYRNLKKIYEGTDNFVLMPLYPFSPNEDVSTDGNSPFLEPFQSKDNSGLRIFGTDDRGRDVFARMAYGFNVSISFAILLAFLEYIIGVPLGGALGYFGGKFDMAVQRFIEIWSTLPILFIIIIVASRMRPSFIGMVALLTLTGWIPITSYMRAEYYREKAKDYVAAAISIGVPTHQIILKHILPNALVPIITYFPFSIVAGISSLVALDFLGFGIPPPTPSWGQMVSVGLANLTKWWLVVVPLSAMFGTLLLTVFIGEGIREAFDPKTFSRLR